MVTEDAFFINYRGEKVNVTTVLDGANIFFSIHLPSPVTIGEHNGENDWTWYDIKEGETELATELGRLIEAADA